MTDRTETGIESWVEKILQGDARAVARAISAVENRDPQAPELMKRLFPHTGRATVLGITGATGSGKSTLVDSLASLLRKQDKQVGILAVDPTSPFTGGALLGDRVRMQAQATDPGTYIRSMGTRGALGGVAAATLDAALVLDAAGKDVVLIETVGVGQDELEIARLADVTLVVLVPGMGDDVQASKAGLMEIADLFVLNKSDLAGADRLEAEVRAMLELASTPPAWLPPAVKTIATEQQGMEDLLEAISRFLEFSRSQGTLDQRRVEHWQGRIVDILRERVLHRVLTEALRNGALSRYAAAVAARQEDPYSVADKILEQAGGWKTQR